ncbi:dihydrodipicolinate synthase family protein [Rhizobium halophytocola]|uniref:4-hydroxy-tetrahydrodipicolinate synthase n=1 Tax=Rhizobium halophytocola TaxID=735519 RepID=A0ABS4DU39_9HYPH|nr:dihydrodipicolinate synthase family protein [Rhizobium halophytocola]MBP1849213.1 4-hydroxy-tetrahydrodipicolinate synthase [Rhizobium halophytocola]
MPLISTQSKGVYVIAVTPFTDNGDVDYDSLDRLVDFYFEHGADGLTILGMMGEAPKLTQKETLEVSRRVMARAGDKPVVVGVSAPGLAAIGEVSAAVMDMGAAGVMVAPPSSLTTNESIFGYYANVVAATGEAPIVLQDFPLSTKVNISTDTLGRILEAHPSIVMLKHEDWPGLAKVSALRAAEEKGRRRTAILCGNGGLFLLDEMLRGADGAMTGYAYPEMMRDVVALVPKGDVERASDIFDAHMPLVRYEQQPGLGLGVRKYLLHKRGAIASSAQRKPGAGLDAAAIADVERMLARLTRRLAELG